MSNTHDRKNGRNDGEGNLEELEGADPMDNPVVENKEDSEASLTASNDISFNQAIHLQENSHAEG